MKKTKKSHRIVLDNQLNDVQMVEQECLLDVKEESKENIIRWVVSEIVTLWFCEG